MSEKLTRLARIDIGVLVMVVVVMIGCAMVAWKMATVDLDSQGCAPNVAPTPEGGAK